MSNNNYKFVKITEDTKGLNSAFLEKRYFVFLVIQG